MKRNRVIIPLRLDVRQQEWDEMKSKLLFQHLKRKYCLDNKSYFSLFQSNPADNYMLKVNHRNTRARCEICSKLTIKIPEHQQWSRSYVFIVNFEHILYLILVFLLLIWAGKCPLRKVFIWYGRDLWDLRDLRKHVRCVARFGTICSIWKTPMEEWK